MPPRVRDRSHSETWSSTYVYANSPFPPFTGSTVTSSDHCEDVSGDYGPDHPFLSTRFNSNEAHPINGTQQTGIEKGTNFLNYYPYYAYASHLAHKTLATTSWATVAARTSPNRPDLNPFSLFQDLYDIPKMLKSMSALAYTKASKLGAKELANQHLMFEFGLLPLISDLKKLLNMQKRVNSTFKRLKTLAQSRGEHRTMFVDADHVEAVTPNVGLITSGSPGPFYVDIRKTTDVKRWASARWKLTAEPPEFHNYEQMRNLAWLITNGITPEGVVSGVWDLIPWSFLIDWFTNVGDYVTGINNTLPVELVSSCMMTQTTTRIDFNVLPSTSSNYTSGGGTCTLTTKERVVLTSSPTITSSVSILDASHASILGSLFIQRMLR